MVRPDLAARESTSGSIPAQNVASQQIVYRKVDELRPNPRNARTHPKRKIRDLAKESKPSDL